MGRFILELYESLFFTYLELICSLYYMIGTSQRLMLSAQALGVNSTPLHLATCILST